MRTNFIKLKSTRFLVIGALLLACVGLEYWLHIVSGISQIFPHLFYIPIIIAAFWWGLKGGLLASLFLGAMHVASFLPEVHQPALVKSSAFIVVGCAVGIMSYMRNRTEERVKRLNLVLRAVRNVNQLIAMEKDKERLIQQSCEIMVNTRGFYCAWILLFDEQKKYISSAVANKEERQTFNQQLERGDYPPCVEDILVHENTFSVCSDVLEGDLACPVRSLYSLGQGLISRLEYGSKVYGIVTAYVPSDYIVDLEEQSLFRELAGDIAFALYNIEQEEQSKQAEEAIRLQEDNYRRLAESISDLFFAFDKDLKYTYWNKASEELTGIPAKDALGKHLYDIFPDDEQTQKAEKAYLQALKTGQPQYFDNEYRLGERGYFFEISAYPSAEGLSVFAKDITERKQAEEALADEATRRRILIEQSRDGIVVLDQDGHVFEVNQRFAEMIGYTMEESLKLDVWDWEYLYSAEQVAEMLRTVDEKGDHFETRHRRKDGSTYDVGISTNAATFGGQKLIFCVCRDITERKLSEEKLAESEKLYSDIANSVATGIYIVQDRKFVFVNESFCKITGYTEKQLIGMDSFKLVYPDDREMVRRKAVGMLKGLSGQGYEYRSVTRSGEVLTIYETVTPIQYQGKRAALGSYMDITERKQIEEQLIVTDRLASVGELASGIAHELNNPLTGVIGFSDLLMTREDVPEDIREDLTIINREAVRASQVARHLLTFARKHPDEKLPTYINNIIRLVLELREYEQRVNNIVVKAELADDLPPVLANDFQLQQVFLNIIINAEHFMIEEHGRGTLTIITEQEGDIVRITLTDDGPGIAPDHLSHIFDPFYTTKEVGQGTGLGLSICYGIITEHGGKIYAESKLGKGATFTIELPVLEEE